MVELSANADVPGTLETTSTEQEVRVVFMATEAQAEASGRVYFERDLLLLDAAGALLAELAVKMELDLLGLGDERVRLNIRSAELISLSGRGAWRSRSLSRPVFWALPSAPLPWAMSDAHLNYDRASRELAGEWKLELPLSPQAYLEGDLARIQITLYSKSHRLSQSIRVVMATGMNAKGERVWRQQGESTQLRGFAIHWSKAKRGFVGKISGVLHSENGVSLERISLRVGSKRSPFNTQMIGLIAHR